jgi:hypothetical protein
MRPMRILMILMALATITLNPAARADFVITSMPPTSGSITEAVPDNSPDPVPTRFKLAFGFGKRIPLSFAVRQIVPAAVKVTYGPGADPDALVDWRVGQGWNRVLFDAVKPLGLRLVMTHMAVEIRK